METLLVVEHENHYFGSPVKHHGPGRVGPSPSKSFRAINCRTFQSGSGILPTPPTTPVSIKTNNPERSKSTSSYCNSKAALSRINGRTNPIAIDSARNMKKEKPFINEGLSFSELWAGPAYSNSPPPSSLPLPKFQVRGKMPERTVSASEMHYPVAKSAPSSLTRENGFPKRDGFGEADDLATAALRRILNLDV